MGTQLLSPKKGTELPIFGPFLLSPNSWMDQDGTWYGGRFQPRRLCVRWGPSFPSPKGAQSPQFSANVRCGQTAGCMKTPLGTEVDLGPGHIVLDGSQLCAKWAQHPPPIFSAGVYCGHGRPSQLLLSSCFVRSSASCLSSLMFNKAVAVVAAMDKEVLHWYCIFMAALCNRGAIIFLPCDFYCLSSIFFFLA